jgi:biotin--protein ligase
LSYREIKAMLKELLLGCFSVLSVTAEEIIRGDLLQRASLFAMPGGRDVPYHEDLAGEGNRQLRAFVERGGGFLGICAGAYYGTAAVCFEKGGPLEVTGSRELGFYPGVSEGPLYGLGQFRYDSEDSARAAQLRYGAHTLSSYYNGGCTFVAPESYPDSVHVVGHYVDAGPEPLPAIVDCAVGEGRAILSGVHIDYRPSSIKGKVPDALYERLIACEEARQALLQDLLARLI